MSASTRRGFLQAGAGAAAAMAQSSGRRPPNFVILFADDMGYGDLACYGHPNLRTPNIDRMAAEGTRFTNWYAAAPVCTPSRVGLLTGRNPIRAGQPNNTGPDTVGGLRLSEILLPQVLKKRGYRTMAIGKWHLGYKPVAQLPTSRGFDQYFGLPYSNDMIPPWVKTNQPLHLYKNEEPIETMGEQGMLTERYTNEAVRFIRESGDRPFFLYVPYAMPHLPISASSRFSGKSRAGLYGDVIETLDWSAGEILRTLKETGQDGNTMVVFTTDNGPWHNLPPRMLAKGVEPWHTGSKGLLRGAKGTSYEGGSRVPGIVRWPGVVKAGQVCMDLGSTLDLFPTVVKAAGGEMPSDRVYDGYDLMPVLRDGAASPRKTVWYVRGKLLEGVREGAWKYRFARGASEAGLSKEPPVPELYNLDWDPAEMYNVYERNKGIGDRLAGMLKAYAAEVGADLSS